MASAICTKQSLEQKKIEPNLYLVLLFYYDDILDLNCNRSIYWKYNP